MLALRCPSGWRASRWLELWGRSCRESSRLENLSESSASGLKTGQERRGFMSSGTAWQCGSLAPECVFSHLREAVTMTTAPEGPSMQMWTQSDCGQKQPAHADSYTVTGLGAQRRKHLSLWSHIFTQHKSGHIARTHFSWFYGQNSGNEIYQCFIYM